VSGPHGFAVRVSADHLARRARSRITALQTRFAPDALASTASRPAFVTTRDPPLLSRRDSTEKATDLGVKESGIFLRGRLDDPNQPEIIQQIAVCAQRY
jgi:hypothetical protein